MQSGEAVYLQSKGVLVVRKVDKSLDALPSRSVRVAIRSTGICGKSSP